MPIKWNPLPVDEALSMVEGYLAQVKEPLEQAVIVLRAAADIPGLPQYVQQPLLSLASDIEHAALEHKGWQNNMLPGRFQAGVARVRVLLPADELARAKGTSAHGNTESLL